MLLSCKGGEDSVDGVKGSGVTGGACGTSGGGAGLKSGVGGVVIKVADRSVGCFWSNAGNMFAYLNDAASGFAVDIFVYNLDTDEATNLTGTATASSVYRRYEINSWSDDDLMINCNYEEIDPSDTSAEVVGNCQVDVATSEVTDL